MNDDLLLSPSSINDFIQCPAKFWYSRWYKRLPIKTETMEFGLTLHEIIAKYYNLIPENLTPTECFMYIRKAVEEVVGSQSLSVVLRKFSWHLKQFEKFEKQRLSWHINPKPLAVEKKYIKPPFMGIVDAIFKRDGKLVVVDWKSGRAPSELPEYYTIQGCIYAYLTNADEIIFYFLTSGRFLRIEYKHCNEVKQKILDVINQIKEGVFTKNRGSHCKECPVQIPCYIDDLNLKLLEF